MKMANNDCNINNNNNSEEKMKTTTTMVEEQHPNVSQYVKYENVYTQKRKKEKYFKICIQTHAVIIDFSHSHSSSMFTDFICSPYIYI